MREYGMSMGGMMGRLFWFRINECEEIVCKKNANGNVMYTDGRRVRAIYPCVFQGPSEDPTSLGR